MWSEKKENQNYIRCKIFNIFQEVGVSFAAVTCLLNWLFFTITKSKLLGSLLLSSDVSAIEESCAACGDKQLLCILL